MFGFAGDWLKEKRFHEEQKNGYKRLLLGKEGSSESVVFYFYLQNFFQKTKVLEMVEARLCAATIT